MARVQIWKLVLGVGLWFTINDIIQMCVVSTKRYDNVCLTRIQCLYHIHTHTLGLSLFGLWLYDMTMNHSKHPKKDIWFWNHMHVWVLVLCVCLCVNWELFGKFELNQFIYLPLSYFQIISSYKKKIGWNSNLQFIICAKPNVNEFCFFQQNLILCFMQMLDVLWAASTFWNIITIEIN